MGAVSSTMGIEVDASVKSTGLATGLKTMFTGKTTRDLRFILLHLHLSLGLR